MVGFFLHDAVLHVLAPRRGEIIRDRTRIFFSENTQHITQGFTTARQSILIDGAHEVFVVHGPFAGVFARLGDGQALSFAALSRLQ